MKKVFVLAAVILIVLVGGIFVIKNYDEDTDALAGSTKVGVLLNGYKEDRNWCQSHYDGLTKTAEQLNLELICREHVANDKVAQQVDELVACGCEIIVANSFEYGEEIEHAAEKYPEIYFFHATGIGKGKNLSTYFGRMYQIRYLSGIVAGLQTETDQIGYVAAFPISEVNRGINAFTLGVRKVNPNAKVYVSWTNSWLDNKATENATNQLLNTYNIDVLAMHTDSARPLVLAEERGVMSIGYNVDNSQYYPDTYLTAAVWDWEKFYTPNILRCLQGKFEGAHYWESIESGIVSLAPFSPCVKDGITEVVEAETKRLEEGNFDVFYGPIVDSEGTVRVADGENMTDNAMLNEFDWYVEGVVIHGEN